MKIEYLHPSKYGNGATVAVEFEQQMAAKGVVVDVHHIREIRPTERVPNTALAWRSAWAVLIPPEGRPISLSCVAAHYRRATSG